VYDNPWTVNSFSSFLALESPAGVGMSVNPQNIPFNDSITATDNYNALLQFFAGFPEYAGNKFWITGESYAGVYIPTLAAAIVAGNARGNAKINLAGLAVGNGCTGNQVGTCGPLGDYYRFSYMAGHTLIAAHQWQAINATCQNWSNESPACQALLEAAGSAIGNVNIYGA
jgi:carboxypeptidase C (cathepsin A)